MDGLSRFLIPKFVFIVILPVAGFFSGEVRCRSCNGRLPKCRVSYRRSVLCLPTPQRLCVAFTASSAVEGISQAWIIFEFEPRFFRPLLLFFYSLLLKFLVLCGMAVDSWWFSYRLYFSSISYLLFHHNGIRGFHGLKHPKP